MNEWLLKIKKAFDKIHVPLDGRLWGFCFFMLVATFFWFLISLSKVYTTTIEIPIVFENIPTDLLVTNELPQKINLKISGKGFYLLRYTLPFEKRVVSIDFSTAIKLQSTTIDDLKYRISTSGLILEFEQQLDMDSNVDLISVNPDVINLNFSRLCQRVLAVSPNLDIQFAQQHQLRGKVKVIPDSVWVTGPANVVDTMSSINTKYLKIVDLSAETQRRVDLEPNPYLRIEPASVVIRVNVEKFTEQTAVIPIELLNVPDSLKVMLMNKTVHVQYLIGLSRCDIVSHDSFRAAIDFSQVSPDSLPDNLPITLIKYPSYTTVVRYTPTMVNYYIQNKNQ